MQVLHLTSLKGREAVRLSLKAPQAEPGLRRRRSKACAAGGARLAPQAEFGRAVGAVASLKRAAGALGLRRRRSLGFFLSLKDFDLHGKCAGLHLSLNEKKNTALYRRFATFS